MSFALEKAFKKRIVKVQLISNPFRMFASASSSHKTLNCRKKLTAINMFPRGKIAKGQAFWDEVAEEAPVEDYLYFCLPYVFDQAISLVLPQILFNIAFSVARRYIRNVSTYHTVSYCFGLVYLLICNGDNFAKLLTFTFLSFLLLNFLNNLKRAFDCRMNIAYIYATICFLIVYYLELDFLTLSWDKQRTMFVIAFMKFFSVAQTAHENENTFISLLEMCGYIFCPANLELGPWISFKCYMTLINECPNNNWNLNRVRAICFSLIKGVLCYSLAECYLTFLLRGVMGRYVLAFRKALTFRLSYYASAYAATAHMVAAGFNNHEEKDCKKWWYYVVKPWQVEFPRSLASAFAAFDVQLYTFLEKYIFFVFKYCMEFSLVTICYLYVVQSEYEALEYSTAIATLVLFGYVQHKFHTAITNYYNACLEVFPCQSCEHNYTYDSLFTRLLLYIFTYVTLLLIIYITAVVDHVGFLETRGVYLNVHELWAHLDFFGHHIIFVLAFIAFLLR